MHIYIYTHIYMHIYYIYKYAYIYIYMGGGDALADMHYQLLTCFTTGIYFDKGGGDTPWGKKFAFDRAEVQEYFFV
jgi:hypothetical protein